MRDLDKIINEYIEKTKSEHQIIAAMVTGSYLTKTMGANSGIDLFFVWEKEDQSMRGRDFYKGVEFEFFMSPEWKYYDRLKRDLISQQIYANGKILLDKDGIFHKIQSSAIERLKTYNLKLSEGDKADYSFYVETIMKDGIGMLTNNQMENFYYLLGIHIPKFCNIIASLKKKYPIYEKYAIDQLKCLDDKLYSIIMDLYNFKDNKELLLIWKDLCAYLLESLVSIDIKKYKSVS